MRPECIHEQVTEVYLHDGVTLDHRNVVVGFCLDHAIFVNTSSDTVTSLKCKAILTMGSGSY